MDLSKFGPFANVVAIGCALVAVFSLSVVKMLGSIRQWSWLASDSPPLIVNAGAKIVAVAVMAMTYATITPSNYLVFAILALVCAIIGSVSIVRFDRMRKVHVLGVPRVARDGSPAVHKNGQTEYTRVVIGQEQDMNATAKRDFKAARRASGGLSLVQFMSGYGATRLNDPEALWDRALLAKISSRLTTSLILITVCAVTTLFLAALAVETASHRT